MKKYLLLPLMCLSLFSCVQNNTTNNAKLIIGLECDYKPFNWSEFNDTEFNEKVSNKSNLYCDGYDVQIAKKLGEYLDMEVQFMQIGWDSLISDLQLGTINAVIAGMTDTPERRETIDFTNEYYRSELVLVTSKTVADNYSTVLNEEEFSSLINGKVVVSQYSTVTNSVIDIFEEKYGAIHANPVDTFGLAAIDVSNNSAFAMTAELPVAQSIVSSFDDLGIIHIDQSILGETQAELGVSIGIKKGDTEFCNKLNEALATITNEERVSIMAAAIERSSN